jgi:hypothetical protein
VTLDIGAAPVDIAATVRAMESSIRAAVRTTKLYYGSAINTTDLEGVKIDIVA